jgi:alkanesulfonate monooxygenase SsuD/methylene tetrahydromethanopterin reductase-like flavin-dependent oxidoreductase (luciferase family)
MRNHKLDFKQRRDILREHVLLMKELWTKDEAEFHGKYVQFEKSWAWPKPTQKPHPKVIMGGALGPKTAAHVAEFCDGWMPLSGLYDFEGGLQQLRDAWRPMRKLFASCRGWVSSGPFCRCHLQGATRSCPSSTSTPSSCKARPAGCLVAPRGTCRPQRVV